MELNKMKRKDKKMKKMMSVMKKNNIIVQQGKNMRKNLGVIPAVFPMPVLMVAAYDESGVANVMNAAQGMICAMDIILLQKKWDKLGMLAQI